MRKNTFRTVVAAVLICAMLVIPAFAESAVVTGSGVNVRSGPGTNYRQIDCLDKGTVVTVTDRSNADWYAISYNGTTGFMSSRYLSITDDNSSSAVVDGKSAYINAMYVCFRSGPGTGYSKLGLYNSGKEVTVTGTSGDWTACVINGKSGYVFSQYVAKGTYTPPTSSGGSATGREIADYALQFVGYNYTWGGTSPSTGFDCSGLMYYVYKQFGYTLNRIAADQARNGVHVDPSDLQPGDLLCFYSGGDYIGHVGMYIGNNMFVHAANSTAGVITSQLSGYYATRGYEARRIV